jgi:hypothetical protein
VHATLRADDHVLLLDIPATAELTAIARILSRGSLVALGSREAVDRAREAMAEFDNVLFLEASPARIPWRDSYFTKILVPPHFEPLLESIAAELHRVMRPDGKLVRTVAEG